MSGSSGKESPYKASYYMLLHECVLGMSDDASSEIYSL